MRPAPSFQVLSVVHGGQAYVEYSRCRFQRLQSCVLAITTLTQLGNFEIRLADRELAPGHWLSVYMTLLCSTQNAETHVPDFVAQSLGLAARLEGTDNTPTGITMFATHAPIRLCRRYCRRYREGLKAGPCVAN